MSARIPVTDPAQPLDCPEIYAPGRPLEVEVGCGKGRFLTHRAAAHPDCTFLGIERMPERVRCFARKAERLGLDNAHVVRLEALYTFWYLLPAHKARTVYVFFPDPWPKRKHRSHRLFGPLFLHALWKRLACGGRLEFATDHGEYFETACACFETDAARERFARRPPMERGPDEWTEFETLFRGKGMPIHATAWEALPGKDYELEPLKVPPEDEPRENVERRESHGKEWREAQREERGGN